MQGDRRRRHGGREPLGSGGSNGAERRAEKPGLRARGARLGGAGAGVSLPGLCWSILQRGAGEVGATLPGGRPCSAVTSGAARRRPQSPELTNLPGPERAEVARATRAAQPTAAGTPRAPRRPSALLCSTGLPAPASGCLRARLAVGLFPRVPRGPSGLRATFLPEAR